MKINTNIKTLKRIAKNTSFELAKVYLIDLYSMHKKSALAHYALFGKLKVQVCSARLYIYDNFFNSFSKSKA